MLFVLLSALSEEGDKAVNIDKRYITKMFNPNLSYANLNSLLISLKQKLTNEGFIGNGNKALFSVFDLISEKKGISSVRVGLQKNRLYLVNNVKQNYTAIDLSKLNSMPCFGAKVVYCWINQYKKAGAFFIKADKLLSLLKVNTSDSCNLGVKLKRMIKALSSIGYEVEIIKEKKGLDARRISALRFNFKEIKQDAVKEIKPATPLELKQDAAMISMGKIKEIKTPTPFKENDALIRFRNSVKQKRHL
ncbi:replication protein [Helicobacter pylori]|nr:replication protein [Helicobacter pylori]